MCLGTGVQDKNPVDEALTEIAILEVVKHPNIIALIDTWCFKDKAYSLVLQHGGRPLRQVVANIQSQCFLKTPRVLCLV
jgi:hypothetical protein